jgi:hypothetical protein
MDSALFLETGVFSSLFSLSLCFNRKAPAIMDMMYPKTSADEDPGQCRILNSMALEKTKKAM